MAVSTHGFRHLRKHGAEAWTMKYVEKNIYEGTRRAQSLSHAFVDVRTMKPPRGQWRPATVSSWKGNPPSHGGIGTPLLIALRQI